MDLLLGSFARKHVPDFNETELEIYENLLLENDPNLYNWIIGKEDAPANIQSIVFEKLKAHKFIQ